MAKSEAEHEEDEEERQRLADRVLGMLEDALYWGIAAVLVIGSVALLIAQFNTMLRLRNTPASTLMLEVLDGLLLLFIFVELLSAVRATVATRGLIAEPFLIVGIIASIKEIVVLSVKAADDIGKGSSFSDAMWEVGVLGVLVLLLGITAWLLRLKEREPGEGDDGGPYTTDAGRRP